MNHFTLRGKTVWITGASSGIGEALSYTLASGGVRTVLSARNADDLERVAAQCRKRNPDDEPVIEPFDAQMRDTFPSIVKRVLDRTGGIDMLVNNAGIGQRATALESGPDVVRRIMDVNFFAPVFLTQELLPSMIARGSGRVVVVSSILGKVHLPGRSAYAASKHALQGYFNTLRTELTGSGVGVTIICPGWIATGFSRSALTANGTSFNRQGKAGINRMSAEVCARKMFRAIVTGKNEVMIGGPEIRGGLLRALFPRLYEAVVRKRAGEFIAGRGGK